MKRRLVDLFLLVGSLFIQGCDLAGSVSLELDRRAFELFGITLFSGAPEVSLKEVHLDTGSLRGKELIIEGAVVEIGDFSTFAVLSDSNARILVRMTGIDGAGTLKGDQGGGSRLRVLGVVESGQRGLPIVEARALSWHRPDGNGPG